MSSNSSDDDGGRSQAPLQKIEQAMLRVGAVRQRYVDANQQNAANEGLLREMHAAVINYYLELRPYRNNSLISEQWETATLWTDNGEPVQGLTSLRQWVTPKRATKGNKPGRGTSSEGDVEADRLPAQALLNVSLVLDDISHELGFSAPTKQATPNDEADRGDLRQLLKARGQTDAAERIPAEADD